MSSPKIYVDNDTMNKPASALGQNEYYIDPLSMQDEDNTFNQSFIEKFKADIYKAAEQRKCIVALVEYIKQKQANPTNDINEVVVHAEVTEDNKYDYSQIQNCKSNTYLVKVQRTTLDDTALKEYNADVKECQDFKDLEDQLFFRLPFNAIVDLRKDILQLCFASETIFKMLKTQKECNLLTYTVNLPNVNIDIFHAVLNKMRSNTDFALLNDGRTLQACLGNMSMKSDTKIQILSELLEAGANLKFGGRYVSTALHYYIQTVTSPLKDSYDNNWKSIIQKLLDSGLDINAVDWCGMNALVVALHRIPQDENDNMSGIFNNVELVLDVMNFLLDLGTNLDLRDGNGRSNIHWGALSLNLTALKLLLERKCDVNIKDKIGFNMVYTLVCSFEWTEDDPQIETILFPMIEMLVHAGCDINGSAIDDSTVLHYAAATKSSKICEKLCQLGADVKAKDYLQRTPLHMAVRNSDVKVVEVLIKYKADIHVNDIKNDTPIHHACLWDNQNAVEMLIELGADIKAKGHLGIQPFHLAAENGTSKLMKYMISKADINVCDDFGAQPLHYAASTGNEEAVILLTKAGSDINQRDNRGMCPLDFAMYRGHQTIADRLVTSIENTGIRFGNLPLGCLPNQPSIEAEELDKYFDDTLHLFMNENTKGIELARKLLDGEGFGKVNFQSEECKLIQNAVCNYAECIVKRIGEIDPLFECELIRAGSMFEEVKTGYPDEFDFLCRMTKFAQYVDRFEYGENEGFAKVIVKSTAPVEVLRFCMCTSFTVNAPHFLRYFVQLTYRARFSVLKEHFDNLYVGAMLLTEIQSIFTHDQIVLSRLNTEIVSFRGQKHKVIDISIDFNPVIFMEHNPEMDIPTCSGKDLSNIGMYVIPKMCKTVFTDFDMPLDEQKTLKMDLWRLSTHRMEAEIINSLPPIGLDCYILCKLFRSDPIICDVNYHEFKEQPTGFGSDLNEDTFRYADQEEIKDDKDNSSGEDDSNIDENGHNNEDVDFNLKTAFVNISTLDNSENLVMAGETFIPSYYLKVIFINEVDRMFKSNEHFTEQSLTSVPRKVYELLLRAFEDEQLFTVLMPRYNVLQTKEPHLQMIYQLRKKCVQYILKIMDAIEFK